ncbi:MAG: histidinol-phosphate transaminase [Sulfuriferula sp.]
MSRYWSPVTHKLTPYIPGEQPKLADLIKLNTNENPYGPSPRVLEALRAQINDGLRLYPDPASDALKAAIAVNYGVPGDCVFVGNGSDEILAHIFLALLKHDLPILLPDISYSFYPVYCALYEIAYTAVPLTADFRICVDDYMHPNGGIIFPNPNAPTGCPLALVEVERLLQANMESVVVIDEAYVDFGGESAVSLVQRYPQLLVVHTLSKSRGLAGLRVGFAIGSPELIAGLTRVKDSFNSYPLDKLAQAGATAAIQDRAYFDMTRQYIIRSRDKLVTDLTRLGFIVLPSAANFIFARHPQYEGERLAALLRERHIIVRHFRQPQRIAPFLRITVGTDAQCQALVDAFIDILQIHAPSNANVCPSCLLTSPKIN